MDFDTYLASLIFRKLPTPEIFSELDFFEFACLQRSEGIGSPRMIGSCALPAVGAGAKFWSSAGAGRH